MEPPTDFQALFINMARDKDVTFSVRDIAVLFALRELSDDRDRRSPKELCQHLNLHKVQMSRSLTKLREQRYITVSRSSKDQRVIHATLSKLGRAALAGIEGNWE